MKSSWLIPRRTALRGLGCSLMLPLLDQMGWAETPANQAVRSAPLRLCYINVPYGMSPGKWTTGSDGPFTATGELPFLLEPMREVISSVTQINGLTLNMEGGKRSHGVEIAGWLTGTPPAYETMRVGISADQVVAKLVGPYTRLPSLELGIDSNGGFNGEGGGNPQVYHDNISWLSPTSPAPKEVSPRAVLQRLFAVQGVKVLATHAGPVADGSAFATKSTDVEIPPTRDRSMIDLMMEDYKRLDRELNGGDRQKIAEYLDSLRAIEKRVQILDDHEVESSKAASRFDKRTSPLLEVDVPAANPPAFTARAALMTDLMALAFQSDTTRIATLMFENAGSTGYAELGFSDDHHSVSHHANDQAKLDKLQKIDHMHCESVGRFLVRLAGLKEGRGTLLDQCMVVFGSGMGDGDAHNLDHLPILLAGRGGGTIRSGRVITHDGTFANLHLALMARMGVKADTFGNSTKLLDLT